MHEALTRIGEFGIVPVVSLENASDALSVGRALRAGGLDVVEITLRTPAAEEAIGILAAGMPDMLVGAGTVLTTELAERALAAGASFVVSPVLGQPVIDLCLQRGVPVVPGVSTPTEIQTARERGLDVVKLFPAEALGGAKTLALFRGVFPGLKFLPTGGIDMGRLGAYLSLDCVLACGGSWMAKTELIRGGAFEEIARLARESLAISMGFELVESGAGGTDRSSRARGTLASRLEELLGLPVHDGEPAPSAPAAKGPEIRVQTRSIFRAAAWLRRKGLAFEAEPGGAGRIRDVVLEEKILGIPVRLIEGG